MPSRNLQPGFLSRPPEHSETPSVAHAPTVAIPVGQRPESHSKRPVLDWLRGKWSWLRGKAAEKYNKMLADDRKDRARKAWWIWFGLAGLSLLVVMLVLWTVVAWLMAKLPFRIRETPQQLIPRGGWWETEGPGWTFVLAILATVAFIVYFMVRIWARKKIVPSVFAGIVGVIAIWQVLFDFHSMEAWLSSLGLFIVLAGILLTMKYETNVPVFLRNGLLVAVAGVFILILPAWQVWVNFPYRLLLWLLAIWLIAKGAWRIGAIKASRVASTDASVANGSWLKIWLTSLALAVVVVALPTASAPLFSKAAPPAGTAGSSAPLGQACESEACINGLNKIVGDLAGKQQKLETLCNRHPEHLECKNLNAEREEVKAAQRYVCDLYVRMRKEPAECKNIR